MTRLSLCSLLFLLSPPWMSRLSVLLGCSVAMDTAATVSSVTARASFSPALPEVCGSVFPVSVCVTGVAKGLIWALVLGYRDVPWQALGFCVHVCPSCLSSAWCCLSAASRLSQVSAPSSHNWQALSPPLTVLSVGLCSPDLRHMIRGIAILLTLVLNSGLQWSYCPSSSWASTGSAELCSGICSGAVL